MPWRGCCLWLPLQSSLHVGPLPLGRSHFSLLVPEGSFLVLPFFSCIQDALWLTLLFSSALSQSQPFEHYFSWVLSYYLL